MHTNKLDFSLILPCYNESSHIEQSMKQIISALKETCYNYEIILIDDKSQDDTAEKIKFLAQRYSHIRVYFHQENCGRGGTVSEGILKAKANIVGFIDIDCEVSPIYIPQFIKILLNKEADIIVGHRYYPFQFLPINDFIRTILSDGYSWIIRQLIKLPVRDTEAGYKFFNRKKIIPVLKNIKDKHWFWDTEIVIRSYHKGLKIQEIPVLFLKRSDKLTTVRIIPDTIAYLKAIYKFRNEFKNEI